MNCLAISVYYYIIEIKFSWFCRRIDEEFGDDYLLRNPEARGSGCYRNRKYKLEETSRVGGLRKINPSGSIIVVSANQPYGYKGKDYATLTSLPICLTVVSG